MVDLESITEAGANSLHKFQMKVQVIGSTIFGLTGIGLGKYLLSDNSLDLPGYLLFGAGCLATAALTVLTGSEAVKMKKLYASDKEAYMEKYTTKRIVYGKVAQYLNQVNT